MIPFSPRMFPDTIRVSKAGKGIGATGGTKETFGDPGPPLACCFRYGPESEGDALPADRTTVAITVAFPSDPGDIRAGDRLVGEVTTARAAGKPRRQDRTGHLWTVQCTAVE